MNWKLINPFLMFFWLIVGLGILFREKVSSILQLEFTDSDHYDMLGYLAIGLSAWNFARWYMRYTIQKNIEHENRLRQEREARIRAQEAPKPITDPQFDFGKRDDSAKD